MHLLKRGTGHRTRSNELLSAPTISESPTMQDLEELFNHLEQTIEEKKVGDLNMSKEVQKNASHLETWIMKNFGKATTGVQISKEVLEAVGSAHWVFVGLTLVAMVLDMSVKMHENKEQCHYILSESLQIWKKVMKPLLDKKEGHASEYMQESICLIIEGYLYCKNLLDARRLKRFIYGGSHKAELETWKTKLASFWMKANAIMCVDIREKLLVPPPLTSTTCATTTVGLEERKRDVIKMLDLDNKEETKVVVLHGMGGVGKSTLGRVVYDQVSFSLRDRCHLEMGENPNIVNLQKQMVENLTGESLFMERDPEAVKDKLCQVLLDEKRDPMFIYIDNVLHQRDLENFLPLVCEKITLPKGSRWLVTTRDEYVCANVFGQNEELIVEKFSVKVMDDRDARKLFCLHAFKQEEPSLEIKEKYDIDQGLIREMATSVCGNLPLALMVLGRSLHHKNSSIWRKTRDDMKTHGKLGLEEQVSNVLKQGYNALDDETKIAFLLICVCFADSTYNVANDVVESMLPRASTFRIIQLGLIEPQWSKDEDGSDAMFIKVHDLVRTLGYQMAVERKWATRMPTCNEDLEDYECWSTIKWLRVPPLEDGIEARFLDQCRELEVIVLDTYVNGKVENTPLQLKVIISNSSCPLEVEKLKKLVYLNVQRIEEFPVAANSKRSQLQVLRGFSGGSISKEFIDMHKHTLRKLTAHVGLMELTPYFYQHMSTLQSLEIKDLEGERCESSKFESLSEEIQNVEISEFAGKIAELSKVASLPKDMGNLARLEALLITSDTIQELPLSLEKLTRLQFLKLDLDNVEEIPSGILGGMRQLIYLHLHLRNLTFLPVEDIGQLSSLEYLHLSIPCVTSLTIPDQLPILSLKLQNLKLLFLAAPNMCSLKNVELICPSLQHLHLHMEGLQVLPPNFITALIKLQTFILVECISLEELPQQMQNLSSLESLLLLECMSLKAIPEGLAKSLQCLVLRDCTDLLQLPRDLDLQKARSMKLIACDKPGFLPTEISSLPNVVQWEEISSEVDTLARQFASYIREIMSPALLVPMQYWSCR